MKKYVKITLAIGFLVIFITCFPFFNALGCNSVFSIHEPKIGTLSGKCEFGFIEGVVNNKSDNERYYIKGRLGVVGDRYFIIGKPYHNGFLADEKKYRYFRVVSSGFIVRGKKNFILSPEPYPVIREIDIEGRLSFF